MTPRTMPLILVILLATSSLATSLPAGAQVLDPTDTIVYPGESIQEAVDANAEGTLITIAAGVHREQFVEPKEGNRFNGEPGAVLNGSKLITSFGREFGLWVITGQTAEGERDGECEDGYTACIYPEQLFIDDVPLWQVDRREDVVAGTFFFDYLADKVYIADDPSGKTVELSTVPHAFMGFRDNVVIRNMTIEKYASPAAGGAINANNSSGLQSDGWRIIGVTVRLNAGAGLAMGDNTTVRNSVFVDNGRVGIGGGSFQGGLIENNVVDDNCWTGGFACFGWGGGGIKVSGPIGTVFRRNRVGGNNGAGIHSDGWAENMIMEDNLVRENSGVGLMVEITYGATITGNRVENNGYGRPVGQGVGILIASTPDVVVSDNILKGNENAIIANQVPRDPGPLGPTDIDRLTVRDNTIDLGGGAAGLKSIEKPNYFSGKTITWDTNTYTLGTRTKPFLWGDGSVEIGEWMDRGFDRSSFGLQ